jgi:hypothetical protein
MSELQTVVYVSSATIDFTSADLEGLLHDARKLNLKTNITGRLLFAEGNFLKLFEGRKEAVEETYGRIKASKRHTGIIQLLNEESGKRFFPEWQMGFARPAKSTILELATARWERLRESSASVAPRSDGLSFLQHFWHLAQKAT